jgi:hypothetical protein
VENVLKERFAITLVTLQVEFDSCKGCLWSRHKRWRRRNSLFWNEDDLLRVEQIVIDHDKDGALAFCQRDHQKEIDRENVCKMKRDRI